jgi:protein transport protein SEC20
MPPLPSTLDEQTQQLVSSAQRLQHDLVDFQISRLRECKGPLATQQRLAAELREDIDRLARYIEVCGRSPKGETPFSLLGGHQTLEVAIGDQRHERDRKELTGIVNNLKTAFLSYVLGAPSRPTLSLTHSGG